MIWESGIETCIISYMKRIANPGSMHDTGCLGLVHRDDPEGWNGEGGGRGVQDDHFKPTQGASVAKRGTQLFFRGHGPESTIIEIDNVNIDYILDTILSSFWKACIETLFHSASSGK